VRVSVSAGKGEHDYLEQMHTDGYHFKDSKTPVASIEQIVSAESTQAGGGTTLSMMKNRE
jgi:hypothetical protein